MGGALRLTGGAKALDLLTVMQEARKNDEKLTRRLGALSNAIVDVHETVRHTQDVVEELASDITAAVEGMGRDHVEMSNLSYMLGMEFAGIKDSLRPLSLLDDLMTMDVSDVPAITNAHLV